MSPADRAQQPLTSRVSRRTRCAPTDTGRSRIAPGEEPLMKGRKVLPLIYGAAIAASAAAVSIVLPRAPQSESARRFAFKKADGDREPGANKRALVGPMDARFANRTAEVEAYLLRAYPASEISG